MMTYCPIKTARLRAQCSSMARGLWRWTRPASPLEADADLYQLTAGGELREMSVSELAARWCWGTVRNPNRRRVRGFIAGWIAAQSEVWEGLAYDWLGDVPRWIQRLQEVRAALGLPPIAQPAPSQRPASAHPAPTQRPVDAQSVTRNLPKADPATTEQPQGLNGVQCPPSAHPAPTQRPGAAQSLPSNPPKPKPPHAGARLERDQDQDPDRDLSPPNPPSGGEPESDRMESWVEETLRAQVVDHLSPTNLDRLQARDPEILQTLNSWLDDEGFPRRKRARLQAVDRALGRLCEQGIWTPRAAYVR